MQGARWWRETTSESTKRKKKEKLKKWKTKQGEELYTHNQTHNNKNHTQSGKIYI